ncbi:hypothetical protein [Aeromicrobium sp. Leaf350]|uniref:hypothetical protein n=1 Tax=Aeromicrobium sp. Leaf350 TaxID=2876565 RepID=UPI001E659C32|nr:hypothetical protein [Aeromicrobium sp. Leaf350]
MFKRDKDDLGDDADTRATASDGQTAGSVDDQVTDQADDSTSSDSADGPAADAVPPVAPRRSRSRDSSEDVDIDTLLRRLDEVARSAGESGGGALRRVTDEVQQHSDALAATSSARQEAQRLLTLATEERERASTAGAAIIEEARQIAARLTGEAQSHAAEAMAEIQRWATGQRESIATVVSDLAEAAHREAEDVRESAYATAMEEARASAETYVSRAAALATRDAEAHRAQAAEALGRTTEVVSAAHGTMQEFAVTISSFVESMSGHLEALQQVVEQAEASRAAAAEQAPIAVDPQSWSRSGLVDDDLELIVLPVPVRGPVEADETDETEGDDTSADEATSEDEQVAETESTDDETPADDAAETAVEETPDESEETPGDDEDDSTPPAGTLPPPPAGRPLGSLFRDPGYP